MSSAYSDFEGPRSTKQSEPIPGQEHKMVANRSGGHVYQLDDWSRLDRFLVLGSAAPTYYASARELTKENAAIVAKCLRTDGLRTVARIVEISESGRAPKNDPALFALAMASSPVYADVDTRRAAMEALPRVARIGTHLFHFAEYVGKFRGWGKLLKRGVASWYNDKEPGQLAYQVVKYQQRDGWSHRDLLRLAHPKAPTPVHDAIYAWVTGKMNGDQANTLIESADAILGYEAAKDINSEAGIVDVVKGFNLTREMIPTQWLNSPDVWRALLEKMPLHALIRNLGKMTSIGVIGPGYTTTAEIAAKLRDAEYIRRSRLHPLAILVALQTYRSGGGYLGSLTWQPVTQIVDALDAAFYLAFGNVEPSNKRTMISLDVSGSMTTSLMGLPMLSARAASAAMALITLATESAAMTVIFSAAGSNPMTATGGRRGWMSGVISSFPLSSRQRLDDVIRSLDGLPFGGTDCSLPVLYAMQHNLHIDLFVVYTDNETWAGTIHPSQALQQYRQKMGIPAKMVVVGMTSNGFTIADPDDSGMLDVVGFDTAAPGIISDFARQ